MASKRNYEYFFLISVKELFVVRFFFNKSSLVTGLNIFFLVAAKLFICREPHYPYLLITIYNLAVAF